MAELVRDGRDETPDLPRAPGVPPRQPLPYTPTTTPPPPALVPPPAAPPAAPTSEMGQWVEEMVRQGILTRAPGNIVATSVNPGGGLGWTDTVTGATSPGVDTLPPDAIANKPV